MEAYKKEVEAHQAETDKINENKMLKISIKKT